MTKKRRALIIVILVLAGLAGLITYVINRTSLSVYVYGMGEGSPAYAQYWRDRLEPLVDPDAAISEYPWIDVMRFENGEWAFGVADDSHASAWGGTVVVKDSMGKVRAFFGHVCGPNVLSRMSGLQSLAAFYHHGQFSSMREYKFP